jgi:hypothetical protein
LIPIRTASETSRPNGRACFEFPRFRHAPGRWFGRLIGASPTIKLTLDEPGTAVWDLVDGRRDVATIADALHARFGNEVEPLHDRLGTLLGILEKNRLVRLR